MSISSEKQKASTAWLADRLREFDIESIMPGTKPNVRVFFNYGPIIFGGNGEKLPNSFLFRALAKLAKDYPSEMLAAAIAMGVGPVEAKNAPSLIPNMLIFNTPLKDVEPDGKRTIFELAADAIRQKLATSAAEPVSTAASPASQPLKAPAKGKAKRQSPKKQYKPRKETPRQAHAMDVLAKHGGHVATAAKELGVKPATIYTIRRTVERNMMKRAQLALEQQPQRKSKSVAAGPLSEGMDHRVKDHTQYHP
jgi:hypothetical protein